MPTLPFASALFLGAGAFAAGLLAGLGYFHWRTRAGYVPLAAHRDETAALRRRYRRRLRALRDASLRHKASEAQLRAELQRAAQHNAAEARLRAAAEAGATEYRNRAEAQEAQIAAREQALEAARARAGAIEDALRNALERIAALERDQGLMRIERDELAARTQRLRALPPETAGAGDTAPPAAADARPEEPAGASRTELAERNARIHDLECRLRESTTRIGELEASLHTWKYRIAPLALHMKMQRERQAGRAPPAGPAADDLKRIRGIGRALERRMQAAGVRRFEQLARMTPAELASLASRIGVSATRPVRERWAEQAQAIAGDVPAAPPA